MRRCIVSSTLTVVVTAILEVSSSLSDSHAPSFLTGTTTPDMLVNDPLMKLHITDPMNGSIYTVPVFFSLQAVTIDTDAFYTVYGERTWWCIEVDDGAWQKCTTVTAMDALGFCELSVGNHTAQAFASDTDRPNASTIRYHLTDPVVFTTLNAIDYTNYVNNQIKAEYSAYQEQSLTEWAHKQVHSDNGSLSSEDGSTTFGRRKSSLGRINDYEQDPVLVIGIKTSVMSGFPSRQAIRETWASRAALPSGVLVLFAGCQAAPDSDPTKLHAIELEKQVYGDLLTTELACKDSYTDLVSKVTEFLHLAYTKLSTAKYVMIADDDIYLRVDRLFALLQARDSHPYRFYAGQVWGKQSLWHGSPIRDPACRYYVDEQEYPMRQYPSFANGPHYIMSMDCAGFIAKNRHRLHGFGALDDVSVAFWLLAMQVHPVAIFDFAHMRGFACKNHLISYADLSSIAIRAIHANLANRQDFCHGFGRHKWLKQTTISIHRTAPLLFSTFVKDISTMNRLGIRTTISNEVGRKNITVTYYPSLEICFDFAQRIFPQIQTEFEPFAPLFQHFYAQLQQHLKEASEHIAQQPQTSTFRYHLVLWQHNLYVDNQLPVVTIVYSPQAAYSKTLFECLFTAVYKYQPVLVMDANSFNERYPNVNPAIFIFSVLDGVYMRRIAQIVEHYIPAGSNDDGKPTTHVVLFSGEADDTNGVDERILLISTVSHLLRKRHVYLSMASASFAERLNHTPLSLLTSQAPSQGATDRKFCAYLYANCNRSHREYMFDLLNAMETVDALGKCAGFANSLDPLRKRIGERSRWYNDEAVEMFTKYKFVIAFENAQTAGYVTEKIVNAFLAGSVPIFYGNLSTVAGMFNPKSFIDCGRFSTLRACATYVLQVHRSTELYEQMVAESPIADVDAFHRMFSWHPDVPSNYHADALARQLGVDVSTK